MTSHEKSAVLDLLGLQVLRHRIDEEVAEGVGGVEEGKGIDGPKWDRPSG